MQLSLIISHHSSRIGITKPSSNTIVTSICRAFTPTVLFTCISRVQSLTKSADTSRSVVLLGNNFEAIPSLHNLHGLLLPVAVTPRRSAF